MCICSTSDQHDAHGEDLLCVRVGRHVAEAHAGQAAEGEVERCDVDAADRGSRTGPIHTADEVIGGLQALPKLMEPPCLDEEVKCGCVTSDRLLTVITKWCCAGEKRKYTINTIY